MSQEANGGPAGEGADPYSSGPARPDGTNPPAVEDAPPSSEAPPAAPAPGPGMPPAAFGPSAAPTPWGQVPQPGQFPPPGQFAPPGPYGAPGQFPPANYLQPGTYPPSAGYPPGAPVGHGGSFAPPGSYPPPGGYPQVPAYAFSGSYPPPGYAAPGWAPPGSAQGSYAAGATATALYPPRYDGGLYREQPQGWQYPPPVGYRRSPEERRQAVRRGLVIALVVVVVVGLGFGIGALLAPTSPKTTAIGLVKSAMSAAEGAGSFHYVQISTNSGTSENITGDAGPDGGRQVITTTGRSGRDVFDLRLVKGVVYFRGNRPAVIDQLGVASGKAATDVDRWVSVHKGDAPYKTFSAGITTKSNLSQLPKTFVARTSEAVPGSSPPATRVRGALYTGAHTKPIGTATMVIADGSQLPESLDGQAVGTTGARLTLRWSFSRWHQTVKVTAPKGALAFSSLGASSPNN